MLGMISRKWGRSVEHKENRCPFMFRLFFLASDRRRDALPSEANCHAEATERSVIPGSALGYFFGIARLSRNPSLIAPKYIGGIALCFLARDFNSTNSILKIAPHDMLARRVVIIRAVAGTSPPISSPHSVPRTFTETGLSSLASRNGFAANTGATNKI